MKKLILFSILLWFGFIFVWCWSSQKEWELPEEELPQESSICPEWFYWFDSVKTCVRTENVE